MRKNKIGTLFLISVFVLAGIGISYAGFSAQITAYGTVDTASVGLEVMDWYSGTWVYKIYGFPGTPDAPPDDPATYDLTNELLIYRGFVNHTAEVYEWAYDNEGVAELVSWAYAEEGSHVWPDQTTSDIDMVYQNLFPCIDFSADFIFHYIGTIPVKINTAEILSLTGSVYPGTTTNFLDWLWAYHATNPGYGAWVEAYRAYPIYAGEFIVGWTIDTEQPVDVGYQLHNCNYVYVKLVIHLPQDNLLQGLSGTFGGKISVVQWTDPCPT